MDNRDIGKAADVIAGADTLLIAAGAGMGVDSGLPDFRGKEGFWRAYPPYRHLGLSFAELANPDWFVRDPALAWGFYGHRLQLYRETRPHQGFEILHRWQTEAENGFVFTSNVDGHFQKAKFSDDRIVECHGSLWHMQCVTPCSDAIWSSGDIEVAVDSDNFRASGPLPICPQCGALARPNVLMFGDWRWLEHHVAIQEKRFHHWLQRIAGSRLVIIESGAGTGVPTVRYVCETLAARLEATLIRINPREPEVPRGAISIEADALPGLRAIDDQLRR